tara:strand:+ start:3979 stop:4347 length:369 start_codon:yes stop_codon:yes gene_type:complete
MSVIEHSGSDGNIYQDPFEGSMTGSLIKTKYVQWTDTEGDDEGELCVEPGVLFDTSLNQYWADVAFSESDIKIASGSGFEFVPSLNEDTLEGCIWIYNLSDSMRTTIENDSQYIATIVSSSL